MPEIVMKKLGEYIGAEVLDVDRDRLLADDDLPQACLDALEEHSVLLLRELNIDDETQAAFCRKLGKLVRFPHYPTPEVMEISFDPDNPNAEYFASNDYWHIDGALDAIPAKASILTAHVLTESGGETEFASTRGHGDLGQPWSGTPGMPLRPKPAAPHASVHRPRR